MCDTLACLPDYTQYGHLIFAKNSDREPDEVQEIQHFPRTEQVAKTVKCTYIDIPQVKETFEVILSKPYQMWGAEMGVNEFGVVIGNEAVFTNVKISKKNNGLTGMDMLRIALERSKSADEAASQITSLLHSYGQDACGGYKNKSFFYHNSFILADAQRAFVLESAGKSWALKEISKFGSISNGLSINTDFDHIHLIDEKRIFPFNYIKKPVPFSFSGHFSDFLYTKVARAMSRKACSMALITAAGGSLNITKTISILKTHNLADPNFFPKKANTASLCMHPTGLTNPSQTNGSMVAEIRKGVPCTVWLTGTSMPCLSIYIPFFMGTDTIRLLQKQGDSPDESLWWKAEKFHRWICEDYQVRKNKFLPALQEIQELFINNEKNIIKNKPNKDLLETFSSDCLEKVLAFYDDSVNYY